MNIFTAVRDLLIPATCVVCGRRLYRNERHICMHCQADMPFTYHRLGEPNAMADAFNALIQTRLPEGRYEPYCSAAALFYYEGEYAKITQALKYDGNVHLGRHFARLAASRVLAGSRHGRPGKTTSAPEEGGDPRSGEDRLSGAAIREPFDTVVPVPLHWRRRFSRGFNQAEVIAREIARHLGVPCRGDILRRRRSTTTQTALDSSDRLSNVAGAFAVRPKALANLPSQARLLLIDDVFTTGSTLYACREALLKLRPDLSVSILTLAYARHS